MDLSFHSGCRVFAISVVAAREVGGRSRKPPTNHPSANGSGEERGIALRCGIFCTKKCSPASHYSRLVGPQGLLFHPQLVRLEL